MILVDRLVGECLPFDGVRGGDDDPLPERLIPAGWVEQVRAGKRERTGVRLRIGELEDHRPLGSREACDDASGALQAGHPEDPRAPDVRMPGGESVADVVEASLRVIHCSDVEDVVALEERGVRLDALRSELCELASVPAKPPGVWRLSALAGVSLTLRKWWTTFGGART